MEAAKHTHTKAASLKNMPKIIFNESDNNKKKQQIYHTQQQKNCQKKKAGAEKKNMLKFNK